MGETLLFEDNGSEAEDVVERPSAVPVSEETGALFEDSMVSRSSPPERETEIIPLIENPRTEIWRPGYWTLEDNNEFAWVPGKVIRRPAPSATWSSARWVRHTYGWTFEQGHWQ